MSGVTVRAARTAPAPTAKTTISAGPATSVRSAPIRLDTQPVPSMATYATISRASRGQNHDGNHIRSSHSACDSGSPVSTGRKKTNVAATTPT